VLGLPILVWLLGGAPHHMSWPELKGFNFEGGTVIQPEFTALLVGLVLYTSAFVAEIVPLGHPRPEQGPERSGDGDRPVAHAR
jgi:general L-amino acid transport system permease protein